MSGIDQQPESLNGRTHRPAVELLLLALPMIGQFASYVVLQFTDTYMLSLVGDVAATAAGNAGGLVWSVFAMGFGTLLILNTLVSQSYGRGDLRECGRYLWQGVWFALGYSALALLAWPWADEMFVAFGHEPVLAATEATYFRICLAFCLVKLLTTAAGQFLLAVNRPGIVLTATLVGVGSNIVANYLLIFGKFGFPELGAAGAAWGTNAALLSELAVLAGAIAFNRSIGARYHCADLRPRRAEMRALLRVGNAFGWIDGGRGAGVDAVHGLGDRSVRDDDDGGAYLRIPIHDGGVHAGRRDR
jgi:MATE family multidrug resistance protein